MPHFIYKITNLINEKIYIGQTNNPSLRWSQHKYNAKYKKGNQLITKAISKYGAGSFLFEVIASCKDQDSVNYIEKLIIHQYDSMDLNKGYNLDVGGKTCIRTKETLNKISNSLKEYYKLHDSHIKGKHLPKEWKENISKSSFGKPGTNKNKVFSDSWSTKISKSLVGKIKKDKRRFSEEIELQICDLYLKELYSTYKLGKQFNCSRSLIINILLRNNVEMRKSNQHPNSRNVFSTEKELEICNYYKANNISMIKLAKQFNCNSSTVRSILFRYKALNG